MTAKEITEILTLSQRLGLKATLVVKNLLGEFGVVVDWDEWSIVNDKIYYEYDYCFNIKDIKEIKIK